jgi:head-tail adaptor
MKIKVGDLDTRISILRETTSADGYGGFTSTGETAVDTIWAKLTYIDSDIKDDFGELQNNVVAEFIVRKRALPGLLAGDMVRIETNYQTFKINKAYEAVYKDFYKLTGTKV